MSFKILSLFYSEFNVDKGAEIIYQLPKNYMTTEEFNKISEFIIPKTFLCNKVLNLRLGNSYLLGFPIFLENKNYQRVRFQFNFCIILDKNEYEENYYLYDNLIKKLNLCFETLEIENEFNFMKSSTHTIKNFMEILYKSLTSNNSEIKIHFEDEDIINHEDFFNTDSDDDSNEFDEEKEREEENSEKSEIEDIDLQKISYQKTFSNHFKVQKQKKKKNIDIRKKSNCGSRSMIIRSKKKKKYKLIFILNIYILLILKLKLKIILYQYG